VIFVPAVVPPSKKHEPAWWFVFRGDKLLIALTNEATVILPCLTDLELLGLKPVREQYLGTLDGRPCYSAELVAHVSAPQGMAFRGLRGLFGLLKEDLFWMSGRAVQIVNWAQMYQYCGRCGTPTVNVTNERAKVCPKCGLMNFPRISPAIIVAIIKGDQILLARAHRHPAGLYSVIAGFVEPGETLEECVGREVKEEVSIEVRNICSFGLYLPGARFG